ncbi:hypothetical protein CYLTODRAFT_352399 [Cylindrobasidium torrendii FP15055 ss-10]|uniref:Signal peptidase complex subunit 2 n=1 Tax=Cylindrobasidium torrendii FP15055 ss-10 TaxID=1314674 RepID=A0A0D7BE58_9AGAR|nr:hypothetical protein CYLTODRAFT_352399 [Cylindrobasidium torrendii FP15055 ss-10]
MGRSKTTGNNGTVASSPSPSRSPVAEELPIGPLSIVVPEAEREQVKVNTASLSELKNACDDAIKRYLSRPELFKQNYIHTDVRLGLGWSSVIVAGFTALYGYKVEFEQSKPVIWIGLILYCALSTIQWLYAFFIEKETIFQGKRKTFSRRIVTERISIGSRTVPVKSSIPPAYELQISYVRSSSNGKSLLAKGKTRGSREYNSFFDEQGTMDQQRLEQFVGELVEQTMEGKNS